MIKSKNSDERISYLSERASARLPLFIESDSLMTTERLVENLWQLVRAIATGVSYDKSKKKWRVVLRAKTKKRKGTRRIRQHIGWYDNEAEAVQAALIWCRPS